LVLLRELLVLAHCSLQLVELTDQEARVVLEELER
jgi:hypothetical protein